MIRTALAVLAIAQLAASPAFALPTYKALTQFSRDVWQAEQGLPQNYINTIVQTRDGYLWLGTEEGLVRFDGVRFTVFDRRNTPAFTDQNVQALYAAPDGTLWIGTRGGGALAMRNDRFVQYTVAQGLGSDRVLTIGGDRDGTIWIGTNGGGLSRWKDGAFTTFTSRDGLTDNRVALVAEDHTGDLWIGTLGGGVTRMTAGKLVPLNDALVGGQSVVAICPARDGTVWIGTDRGVVRYVNGHVERYVPASLIDSQRVLSLLEDRDGTIWVGTSDDGLGAIRNGGFDRLRNPALTSNVVVTIAEDREGSLWVGTGGGGLNRLRDTSFASVTTRDGLPHDIALATFEDRFGVLWVGTYGGGVATVRDGIATPFLADPTLSRSIVYSVAEDSQGALWFATGDAGVFRVDRTSRRVDRFGVKNGLAHDAAHVVVAEGDDVWVGTRGGLSRIRNRQVTSFTTRDGLTNDYVRALLAERDGGVWLGTNGGGLLHFKNGAFSAPVKTSGLAGFVRSIYRDGAGVLWIGTSGGGLLRASGGWRTPPAVATLTTRDGLADDVIFQILDDGEGNLWLSSNKGIARVSKTSIEAHIARPNQPLVVKTFGRADGMLSPECNGGFQPAGSRDRAGRLWFPTVRGVVAIDPAHLLVNVLPPPVVIEDGLVDKRTVDLQRDGRFPVGDGALEFHFTALSLVDPSRVKFRYQLEGFDRDWIDAGSRRAAFYTNMPSGRYTFRVRASNNDGVWSTSGAAYAFSLAPPFYQTLWFYGICIAALAGTLTGAYQFRLNRAEAREAELLRLVEERTSQLQQANDHLQRLSYVDALTNIANRRHFEEILEMEWRRALRSKSPVALLMMDIDHFKAYNDTFGHRAGDICLIRVAAALDESVQRAGDLVARYGGEEFAAVLAGTNLEGAAEVGERLRAAVEALGIDLKMPENQRVTISIGIAAGVPGEVESSEALLGAADQALYQAKRAGRNCVRLSGVI